MIDLIDPTQQLAKPLPPGQKTLTAGAKSNRGSSHLKWLFEKGQRDAAGWIAQEQRAVVRSPTLKLPDSGQTQNFGVPDFRARSVRSVNVDMIDGFQISHTWITVYGGNDVTQESTELEEWEEPPETHL